MALVVKLPVPKDARMLKDVNGKEYWDLTIFPLLNLGSKPLPEGIKLLSSNKPELFKLKIYFEDDWAKLEVPVHQGIFHVGFTGSLAAGGGKVITFEKDLLNAKICFLYLLYRPYIPKEDFWENF